jgi:hypothetical protein
MTGEQLTIEHAIAQGDCGMARSNDRATRVDPEFNARTRQAILAHLGAAGPTSGEVLTDVAKAHGARPHDDRAFGAVFKALSRAGQIRTVGYCARTRGHGTSGGRIWSICQ